VKFVIHSLLVLSSLTSVAQAHDDVDEGVRLTGLAEFDDALAAFARAEAAADLTRQDLVVLYESRAILLAALGRTDAMERDLERLAALEPTRSLPGAAPPEVAERFAVLAAGVEPVEVLAVPAWDVGAVTVRGVTSGGPSGFIRRVHVGARLTGRDYAFGDGRVQLVTTDGSNVEYFAEAIGPGGAVVATVGSAEAPLASARPASAPHDVPTDDPVLTTDPAEPERGGGLSVAAWLLIGAGIAVVVVTAVITGIVVANGQGSPDTMLGGPMAVPP
jgi:hypothetical protein